MRREAETIYTKAATRQCESCHNAGIQGRAGAEARGRTEWLKAGVTVGNFQPVLFLYLLPLE